MEQPMNHGEEEDDFILNLVCASFALIEVQGLTTNRPIRYADTSLKVEKSVPADNRVHALNINVN
jgi:hypothetical protein